MYTGEHSPVIYAKKKTIFSMLHIKMFVLTFTYDRHKWKMYTTSPEYQGHQPAGHAHQPKILGLRSLLLPSNLGHEVTGSARVHQFRSLDAASSCALYARKPINNKLVVPQ